MLTIHKTLHFQCRVVYFGVNKFAPLWEAMVDKIFGALPRGVAKEKFNPHLRFVAEGSNNNDGVEYQDDDDKEKRRSTLRPDTIMALESGVFVLDSKYYKYGLTKSVSHLPGAESVCKQMAYAEYVEMMQGAGELPGLTSGCIYNAFVMPYCADAEGYANGDKDGLATFRMKRSGYIYGDWKDRGPNGKNYHKIHCILLDMKSVMRNYGNNPNAQKVLAGLIKDSK